MDMFIVMVSIYSIGSTQIPNAKLLRLVRVTRVIRLFSALKSLNRIIVALGHAMGPVCNACLMLLIVSCVYAIVATGLFAHLSPEFFGRFQHSLFTFFQILSGDSWASTVVRSLFQHEEVLEAENPLQYQAMVSFFFVSYYLICGLVFLSLSLSLSLSLALSLSLSLYDSFSLSLSGFLCFPPSLSRLLSRLRDFSSPLPPLHVLVCAKERVCVPVCVRVLVRVCV